MPSQQSQDVEMINQDEAKSPCEVLNTNGEESTKKKKRKRKHKSNA